MRWVVRDVAAPFDPVGYVNAPSQDVLAASGFRFDFPLSRWMNDHPRHFTDVTKATVRLEIGLYRRHGADCHCGACPPADACFMSMGHPYELLRRIVGFHPVTVLYAKPASIESSHNH